MSVAQTSAVPAFPSPSRNSRRAAEPAPSPVQAPGSSWSQIRAELQAIRPDDEPLLTGAIPARREH